MRGGVGRFERLLEREGVQLSPCSFINIINVQYFLLQYLFKFFYLLLLGDEPTTRYFLTFAPSSSCSFFSFCLVASDSFSFVVIVASVTPLSFNKSRIASFSHVNRLISSCNSPMVFNFRALDRAADCLFLYTRSSARSFVSFSVSTTVGLFGRRPFFRGGRASLMPPGVTIKFLFSLVNSTIWVLSISTRGMLVFDTFVSSYSLLLNLCCVSVFWRHNRLRRPFAFSSME